MSNVFLIRNNPTNQRNHRPLKFATVVAAYILVTELQKDTLISEKIISGTTRAVTIGLFCGFLECCYKAASNAYSAYTQTNTETTPRPTPARLD